MKTVITLPLSLAERAAIPPFLAEYSKACDAAWAEYSKACDAAWAEYSKARDAAWAECSKARDASRAEYSKARDASRAEYSKARDASPLVAWIVGTFLEDREDTSTAVLEALADGATMADLVSLAEREGWCGEWDVALAAASELFDIR